MVTHQKKVYYRHGIWQLHITHKTNTRWQLPCICQFIAVTCFLTLFIWNLLLLGKTCYLSLVIVRLVIFVLQISQPQKIAQKWFCIQIFCKTTFIIYLLFTMYFLVLRFVWLPLQCWRSCQFSYSISECVVHPVVSAYLLYIDCDCIVVPRSARALTNKYFLAGTSSSRSDDVTLLVCLSACLLVSNLIFLDEVIDRDRPCQ